MDTQQPLPAKAQMMQLITGFWTSCCIYTAAKLNIADVLGNAPQTAEQLAEATHAHAPSMYRMMRALASVDIFNENGKGEFSHTALSETLKSDVPGSMKAMAIAQLGDHYQAWGNLLYSIKTGNIAFDMVEGMDVWKYYETHPEDGLNFIKAMSGATKAAIQHVVPAYDFSSFNTIVDLGGGNGTFLMAILETTEKTKGMVFDLEYVVAETQKVITAKHFNDRCSIEAGSLFHAVPEGADAYMMKHILHDWNDEKSIQMLNNCNKAMTAESKLLVIESVIPEGNTPHPGKFMDINMMAMTGGKERTEREFSELFSKAGLRLNRVIHTPSPTLSILEVIKP